MWLVGWLGGRRVCGFCCRVCEAGHAQHEVQPAGSLTGKHHAGANLRLPGVNPAVLEFARADTAVIVSMNAAYADACRVLWKVVRTCGRDHGG